MGKSFQDFHVEAGALIGKMLHALAELGQRGVNLANAVIDGVPVYTPHQMQIDRRDKTEFEVIGRGYFADGVVSVLCAQKGGRSSIKQCEPTLVTDGIDIYTDAITRAIPPIRIGTITFGVHYTVHESAGSTWYYVQPYKNGREIGCNFSGKNPEELAVAFLSNNKFNLVYKGKDMTEFVLDQIRRFDEIEKSVWTKAKAKNYILLKDEKTGNHAEVYLRKGKLWVTKYPF